MAVSGHVARDRPAAAAFFDRDQEREVLARLLEGVREGNSGRLVIGGEAGVGKSALLDEAARVAPDFQDARVVGIESEMELGFAALHQLLLPFLPLLHRLPRAQREALDRAFGVLAGDPPDRCEVGLAALTLAGEAGLRRPILCIVDDAQWLDRASLEALAFVARNMTIERVAMVFAVRDNDGVVAGLDGLPELELRGLPRDAAGQLLRATASCHVAVNVRERILDATGGNPLEVIELARELSAAQLSGAAPLPEPLPVGERLERLFLRRVHALPASAQTLLLVAAAEPSCNPSFLWSAAGRLGVERDAADAPELAHIIQLEPRLEFRHHLVRSAVYHGAPEFARRAAHSALAAACDCEFDEDRRWFHLAAAASGTDEDVAAGLERCAARAKGRGSFANCAALLERAAQLTPSPTRRAQRSLAAAQAKVMAGDLPAARNLLKQSVAELDDPSDRARAKRLEGSIQLAYGNTELASNLLLGAALRLRTLDARLSRDTLHEAFNASFLAGTFAPSSAVREVLQTVRGLPPGDRSEETSADRLLDGFAAIQEGEGQRGTARLREAVRALIGQQPLDDDALRSLLGATLAAYELLDRDALDALTSRLVRESRSRGAMSVLPSALSYLAYYQVTLGHFASADRINAEAIEIAAATGAGECHSRHALAAVTALAWRGREAETRELASTVLGYSTRGGYGLGSRLTHLALVVLELSLARYREALTSAKHAYGDGSLMGALVAPELIEAAVRCDAPQIAKSVFDAFSSRVRASPTDWGNGMLLRSQALLAGDDDAEGLYRGALHHLDQSGLVPQLGRAHLLYGQWLRRQRRRRDARRQLCAAHEIFERIGARAFAQRTRVELLATGERARKRTDETRDELTPQERQVAHLASQGASNREIAGQLSISSSTVACHLKKVFRKLGIARRSALARALSEQHEIAPAGLLSH